jgi:hypothetical protein
MKYVIGILGGAAAFAITYWAILMMIVIPSPSFALFIAFFCGPFVGCLSYLAVRLLYDLCLSRYNDGKGK